MDYTDKPLVNKPAFGIVGCEQLAQLPILINREIEDGYEPIGAPFFEPNRLIWCQAMYKRPLVRTESPQLRKHPIERKAS